MKPRNQEIFSQVKSLSDFFIDLIENYKFVESYGTLFDRVDALVHGDPKLIAKILELRNDIKEEILSTLLTLVQRYIETLTKSDI